MHKVVIFGTSAAASLFHFSLSHDSPNEVVAFTVDQCFLKEEKFRGLPVVPFEKIESLYPPDDYKIMLALLAGRTNKTRAEKYHQARAKGYELISYISSRALTWPDLVVGDNCFIGEGTICRPFLTIGSNVMIMAGAFLGHDSVIKDHCFVASRATILGAVTVESYSVIGANSTVLDGITIAQASVIGAGCVIHENTQEKGVYRALCPTRLPLPSDKLDNFLFRWQQ